MSAQEIKDVIVSMFGEKENFKGIGLDDDYFDLGVSSLTIIAMQIRVEEKLGLSVDTRTLMGLSTINQWVDAYIAASQEAVDA